MQHAHVDRALGVERRQIATRCARADDQRRIRDRGSGDQLGATDLHPLQLQLQIRTGQKCDGDGFRSGDTRVDQRCDIGLHARIVGRCTPPFEGSRRLHCDLRSHSRDIFAR